MIFHSSLRSYQSVLMLIPFETSRVHPSHMAEACGKTREPTRCIHHWIWKVKKYSTFEATKIKRQLRFAAYLSEDMHKKAGNSGVSPFHTICRSFSKDFPIPFLQLLGFSPVILASTEHGTDTCAHRSCRDCGIWKNPSWEEIILRAHSRIWNNFWIFLAMGISNYDLKLLIQPPLILHFSPFKSLKWLKICWVPRLAVFIWTDVLHLRIHADQPAIGATYASQGNHTRSMCIYL